MFFLQCSAVSSDLLSFPTRRSSDLRDLFHFLKINLVNRVAGAMVVFVLSVEEENYGNAFARIIVMIAAEEETVGIVGIVVAIVDRKSTRLNSSHVAISYAVFCLKKK